MAGKLIVKHFTSADETRPFNHGRVDVISTENGPVMRAIFEPGWKWSNDVKPLAGTSSCQTAHCCYVLSGRMHLKMDDGTEAEVGPGDFTIIPPGHDGWVIGNEACVMFDYGAIQNYARDTTGAGRSAQQRH